MGAIAGIRRFDGREETTRDTQVMATALSHRGPDGNPCWSDDSVGMAELLLATGIRNRQARHSVASLGSLVIVVDARIDNRGELGAQLGVVPDRDEVNGDRQLILHAYRTWGEACVERLLGDFAFAIWDGTEQRIFCARDHMGVKPFYYFLSPSIFAFASEIKALLELADVPCELNEEHLYDYLVADFEDREPTLYQGIFRLPAAHSMVVNAGRKRLRRYWALDPARELRLGSDAEYEEAFRITFQEAVRCRLSSPESTGAFLSGGLDSSSIACMAQQLYSGESKKLKAFSAIYDSVPKSDERRYIEAVAAHADLNVRYVHPDGLSPLRDWETDRREEDEPLWNPQLALHWSVFERAKAEGVRVLLDGVGGDSVISYGDMYLTELFRRGQLLKFWRELQGVRRQLPLSIWEHLKVYAIVPQLPEPMWKAWRGLRRRQRPIMTSTIPLASSFANRMAMDGRRQARQEAHARRVGSARLDHWLDLSAGLDQFVLEQVDRAAGLFQIEPRYPFYDRRLMELCLALPAELKLRAGWPRLILRSAMGGVLPDLIRWRPDKANLSYAFDQGLLSTDAALLERLSLNGNAGTEQYIDLAVLDRMRRAYVFSGARRNGFALWRAAVMERWLQRSKSRTRSAPMEAIAGEPVATAGRL